MEKETENVKVKRRLWLDICIALLKVLLPIVVLAVLVICTVGLVNIRAQDLAGAADEGYFSGYGLYFFATIVIMLVVDLVALILGTVFLFMSVIFKRSLRTKKNVRAFIIINVISAASLPIYALISAIILRVMT